MKIGDECWVFLNDTGGIVADYEDQGLYPVSESPDPETAWHNYLAHSASRRGVTYDKVTPVRVRIVPADSSETSADVNKSGGLGTWRTMESAPKDGTWVLVYGDLGVECNAKISHWMTGQHMAYYCTTLGWREVWSIQEISPTHWRHLPPPPETE